MVNRQPLAQCGRASTHGVVGDGQVEGFGEPRLGEALAGDGLRSGAERAHPARPRLRRCLASLDSALRAVLPIRL